PSRYPPDPGLSKGPTIFKLAHPFLTRCFPMKGNRLLYFGYTKSQIKHIVIYAVSMASLVFLLKWLQWKYLITDHSLDVYITLIALFFTVLGIWIATQLSARKTETGADNQRYVLDEAELGKMN